MLPDLDARTLRLAVDLIRAQQPLATAVVCAQLARSGFSSAELWCALGSSLMASRGVFVREPFERWAAKVFRRGAPEFTGTAYAAVVQDWLQDLPEAAHTAPLADAEIAAMIDFLLIHERVLADAAQVLDDGTRMAMVMVLGDRVDPLFVPLLREAIVGKLGDGAARSALKRIGAFSGRADVQGSLVLAHHGAGREAIEPYLGAALARLPAGWDRPRSEACPPYEGSGHVDIELVAPGPNRDECERILAERLAAPGRDTRSWVEHGPCLVKRGATRHDAMLLVSALEQAGASARAHGLDDPPRTGQPAARRPWWKFW